MLSNDNRAPSGELTLQNSQTPTTGVSAQKANQISKKLAFGFGGNPYIEELPPQVAQRLGGTLDEVIESLGDLTGMFEEAKIFSKV